MRAGKFLRSRLLRIAAAALIGFSGAVVTALPARASNILGHLMPSSNITIRMFDITDPFYNATVWVAANDIDPTDMFTFLYLGGADDKMLNVTDFFYGNTGWYGRWSCQAYRWAGSIQYCDKGLVQFNLNFPPGGGYDDTEARSLACEEIGHAIGLAHNFSSSTSCMSQDWADTNYDSHDRSHINSWY